jgi:hypothetical protein
VTNEVGGQPRKHGVLKTRRRKEELQEGMGVESFLNLLRSQILRGFQDGG